jgi:hypothetical protein
MPELDFSELNLSEAYNVLSSLGILLVGIVIYSIFIFKFYRFLASRDIIKVDFSRYSDVGLRFSRWIGYLLQNIFLFPVIIFFGSQFLPFCLVSLEEIKP